jgi:hypothetical protein
MGQNNEILPHNPVEKEVLLGEENNTTLLKVGKFLQ